MIFDKNTNECPVPVSDVNWKKTYSFEKKAIVSAFIIDIQVG
jgi:hypothetical protein